MEEIKPRPEWEESDRGANYECSECGYLTNSCSDFCPQCGARMEETEWANG